MPDLYIFLAGLFVTSLVAWAVYSVGEIDRS